MTSDWQRPPGARCGDCGAEPGQAHADGCDVARCLLTGRQRIQCEPEHEHPAETRAALVAAVAALVDEARSNSVVAAVNALLNFTTERVETSTIAERIVDAVDAARYASCGQDIWTGQWPGNDDAAALGLWCYWGPDYGESGWVECDDRPEHPGARPDLNRLRPPYARWDPTTGHWVAP